MTTHTHSSLKIPHQPSSAGSTPTWGGAGRTASSMLDSVIAWGYPMTRSSKTSTSSQRCTSTPWSCDPSCPVPEDPPKEYQDTLTDCYNPTPGEWTPMWPTPLTSSGDSKSWPCPATQPWWASMSSLCILTSPTRWPSRPLPSGLGPTLNSYFCWTSSSLSYQQRLWVWRPILPADVRNCHGNQPGPSPGYHCGGWLGGGLPGPPTPQAFALDEIHWWHSECVAPLPWGAWEIPQWSGPQTALHLKTVSPVCGVLGCPHLQAA